MRALKELKELILSEIDKVNQKNDLSSSELQNMYYAVDVIKDIDEIVGSSGNSERGSYNSYDGSYRRGRDNRTGRYISRGGSYDSSYDSYNSLMNKLDRMRSNAPDERTRQMVSEWMDETESQMMNY